MPSSPQEQEERDFQPDSSRWDGFDRGDLDNDDDYFYDDTDYQMTIFYEVTIGLERQDFPTAEEAAQAVERHGDGQVVRFYREPNNHGGFRNSSTSMWTRSDGVWRVHYIFDGYGRAVGLERPSDKKRNEG